jgi:hypothetical protein
MIVRDCVAKSTHVIVIAELVHPHDVHAVERFLDSNVGHRRSRRRTVPMLVTGRAPGDVAGADLDFRLPLALGPSASRGDDERLPQGMGMPCRAGTQFEGHARTDTRADEGGEFSGSIRTVPMKYCSGPFIDG